MILKQIISKSKGYRRLLPWYIAGRLSPKENHLVEQQLIQDSQLRRQAETIQVYYSALKEQPMEAPAPIVRQRIMAAINRDTVAARRTNPLVLYPAALMLAFAVLIVLWMVIRPGNVLEWTVTDLGIQEFQVYRAPLGGSDFELVSTIPVRSQKVQYTFVDALLIPGQSYTYLVKGVQSSGQSLLSQTIAADGADALMGQILLILTSLVVGYLGVTLVQNFPLTVRKELSPV